MLKRVITVKLKEPTQASEAEVATFIRDALESWGGQFHPDDDLFHSLSIEHVKIGDNIYI